jgi:hypothetical protein
MVLTSFYILFYFILSHFISYCFLYFTLFHFTLFYFKCAFYTRHNLTFGRVLLNILTLSVVYVRKLRVNCCIFYNIFLNFVGVEGITEIPLRLQLTAYIPVKH